MRDLLGEFESAQRWQQRALVEAVAFVGGSGGKDQLRERWWANWTGTLWNGELRNPHWHA